MGTGAGGDELTDEEVEVERAERFEGPAKSVEAFFRVKEFFDLLQRGVSGGEKGQEGTYRVEAGVDHDDVS